VKTFKYTPGFAQVVVATARGKSFPTNELVQWHSFKGNFSIWETAGSGHCNNRAAVNYFQREV